MLRAHTKGRQPSIKETARWFVLVAGDNAAEGQSGHMKNTMRRLGNIGRCNMTTDVKKNIQALGAAAVLRQAGLSCVLSAAAAYRQALSSGVVSRLSPALPACWGV